VAKPYAIRFRVCLYFKMERRETRKERRGGKEEVGEAGEPGGATFPPRFGFCFSPTIAFALFVYGSPKGSNVISAEIILKKLILV
jgi:hypothetical protein